ncbi:hypothetical protein DFH06DRAFT_1140972 [Mycena polygramma]|nr:hypothetical protein DFH06DRAFT_1140972 [Mycena polygramma]
MTATVMNATVEVKKDATDDDIVEVKQDQVTTPEVKEDAVSDDSNNDIPPLESDPEDDDELPDLPPLRYQFHPRNVAYAERVKLRFSTFAPPSPAPTPDERPVQYMVYDLNVACCPAVVIEWCPQCAGAKPGLHEGDLYRKSRPHTGEYLEREPCAHMRRPQLCDGEHVEKMWLSFRKPFAEPPVVPGLCCDQIGWSVIDPFAAGGGANIADPVHL